MPSLDYRAIRREIRLAEVLDLCSWKGVWLRGNCQRGPCPVHHSSRPRSRVFVVTLEQWYCHACKKGGDCLDLYAEVTNMPLYEATLALCHVLGQPAYQLPTHARQTRSVNGEEAR